MVAGVIDGVGVGRWRAVDVSWQRRGLVVVVVGVLQLVEVEDMLDLKLEVMGRCLVLPPPWSLLLRMEVLLVLYEKVYCLWSLSLCAGCGLGWWWCFVPLASVRDDGVVAGVGDVVVPATELAEALLRPPPSSGPQLVLLLHLLLVRSFPTLCVVPSREQFIRQWLCSSLLQGGWIWGPSPSSFLGSCIHAGWAIRVELMLLRFNGELRGEVWLSPVKLTPKSTAQQQISNLCILCEGVRRGLPVRQAVCMSKETQGSNRRGFAAAPCRFAPSTLPSFRRLFVLLV